jgi:hypothetical protein
MMVDQTGNGIHRHRTGSPVLDVTGGSTSGDGSVSAEQYAKLMEKYNAALLGSGPKRSGHQR